MSTRSMGSKLPCKVMYALVPAQPLPAVDLSKSFRGRLLPARVHTYIRRRYYKYHRPFLVCSAVSFCLDLLVVVVKAPVGQTLAILAFILWMPIGFGSVTTLRYDIVRLVYRTFDFWFFSVTTSLIVVTMSMYFSDLRGVRMLIDWFGFHHVIFVDAHVLGLRFFIYTMVIGILSLCIVFVWSMLGQVDGSSTFSIVQYESSHKSFQLSGLDVIGNCLVSLGFLLAKIIFRRRKMLQIGHKRSSSLVQCVIYRCRLKLEPVHGPQVSLPGTNDESKEISVREANIVQHLLFVNFPQTFDAANTLLQSERDVIQIWMLGLLYTVGAAGFLLSQGALFNELATSADTEYHKRFELLLLSSLSGLLCTVIFTASFVAFCQRQLLKLLLYSFDFAFYSFQVTTANLCVCSLYQWGLPQCLMVLSWWFWAHWAFALDALTPTMRNMFRFHIRVAAPVVGLLLINHLALIYQIFFADGTQLHDSIIVEGVVWGQRLVVRVIPVYVSRAFPLLLWCSRLVVRLGSASNDEVSILRGTVCYDNVFAKGRRTSSQIAQGVEVKNLRRTKVSPLVLFPQDH